MVDLPPEIWYHIISFIPSNTLRRFYALNRTFFNEAMTEKYRNVVIDSKDHKLFQVLNAIRNPVVSSRVESVHIILDRVYYSGAQDDAEESLPKITYLNTSQAGSSSGNAESASTQHMTWSAPLYYDSRLFQAQTPTDVLEAIRGLHCLDSVHIEWNFFEAFPSKYADLLWSTVTPHPIKTIAFTSTTTGLKTLIPPSSATLNSITSIFLTIRHRSNATKEDLQLRDLQLLMASLVNSLRGSLHTIHIKPIPFHDLALFWECLEYFPYLETITMDITTPSGFFNPDQPLALPCYSFLTRHKGHLENVSCRALRLCYLNPDLKLTPDFIFPKLKSLSIDANILTGRRLRLVEFLNEHKHVLESFEVLGEISPAELDEVLNILTDTPRGPTLTCLSVSIYRLDLNLLQKLARLLPTLQMLKLCITSVASHNATAVVPGQYFPLLLPPHNNVHGFVKDIMACQEISHWDLRHITINRVSCCSDLTLWNLMRLLALNIPTISRLADKRYQDIPEMEDLEEMKKGRLGYCPRRLHECFHGQDGLDASPF